MTAMAILSNVLRVLSDFGDAAGWLIAAGVLFFYGRRIIAENEKAHAALDKKIDAGARENEKAHAAIMENVRENRRRIEALGGRIDTAMQSLGAIAKDVAFLAGRQVERDRATGG